MTDRPALLLDLDGTLVDSVYQHAIAWHKALELAGIKLSVWRIHRRIGMSGGLLVNALLRETGREMTTAQAEDLQKWVLDWPLVVTDPTNWKGLERIGCTKIPSIF